MITYDLSVVIPARNEMFVNRTVDDLIHNKRGKTEVIVGLDGEWANPPIKDYPDVTIIYSGTSIGQRAITNQCVKLSRAKYIMKIDAHCTVDEGYDVKMMSEMKDNYTMIPVMYNLHAFDWLCTGCSHRIYQGPTPKECPKCKGKMVRDMIWKPRMSRRSEFYRFDTTLHFQYHGARKKDVPKEDILVETQSAQGSCFMLTREKYWELDICDETHGSWGQQGTEVACKTWLSGGRLVTNRKTWYSHMFRTQGGDFGFPYPQSGRQVENARKHSKKLFLENTFHKQIYPLSWLLEKFKPLPDWHDPSGKESLEKVMREGEVFWKTHKKRGPTKAIVYYTDNELDDSIALPCRKQLLKAGLPIYSVSLKPINFGTNIVLNEKRGYLTLFKQLLAGFKAVKEDIIYICDHDVLYHPSHFEKTPERKDIFYYDYNVWKVRLPDGYAIHYDAWQSNMLCAYKDILIEDHTKRVEWVTKNGWSTRLGFEPGTQKKKDKINDYGTEIWLSLYPSLDLKHGKNLTRTRFRPEEFRNGIRSTPNWKEVDHLEDWGMIKGKIMDILASR